MGARAVPSSCLLCFVLVLGVAVGIDTTGQAGQGWPGQARAAQGRATQVCQGTLLCGSEWVPEAKVKLGSGRG